MGIVVRDANYVWLAIGIKPKVFDDHSVTIVVDAYSWAMGISRVKTHADHGERGTGEAAIGLKNCDAATLTRDTGIVWQCPSRRNV